MTLITQGHVPDEVFERARAQFSEEELINLTMAVVSINCWNRLNISLRTVPGSYQQQLHIAPQSLDDRSTMMKVLKLSNMINEERSRIERVLLLDGDGRTLIWIGAFDLIGRTGDRRRRYGDY